MTAKLTVPDIINFSNTDDKLTMMTAYDYPSALFIEKAGLDTILVGDSLAMTVLGYDSTVPITIEEMLHHTKAVVRGAKNTFIIADMPFGSYNADLKETINNASRFLKEGGADAVKLEGGTEVADTVKAVVKAGIPVLGHIGLTPQTVTQLGGYKVQGKNEARAQKLIEDAKALDEAGAFGVVLECIPMGLASEITEATSIPTIGIGGGPHCNGQVLVYNDVLGLFDKFTPKFVKPYANIGSTALEALQDFNKEVKEGKFPSEEYSFKN